MRFIFTKKEKNMFATKDSASDLRNTAFTAKRDIRDAASDMKEDLTDAANNAGRKVRDFIHNAGGQVGDVSDRVAGEIRTNPVRSTLVALGVGVLLGAIFRRA
jgi:hypothetical protein